MKRKRVRIAWVTLMGGALAAALVGGETPIIVVAGFVFVAVVLAAVIATRQERREG